MTPRYLADFFASSPFPHTSTKNFEAIPIMETFLTLSDSVSHLQLPGCNLLQHDRIGRAGGGVALYVRTHWRVSLLDSSDFKYDTIPEYIIVKLRYKSDIILIAVVCRRPIAASSIDFFDVLAPYLPNYKHVIITGDFTTDLQSPQRADTRTLTNLVNTHALAFVSCSPTHHLFHVGHESHTALDLFLTIYQLFYMITISIHSRYDFIELTIPFRAPLTHLKQ